MSRASTEAYLNRSRVRFEPFLAGQRDDRGCETLQALARHSLNCRNTHEIGGVQASAETGGAVCRQNMIRADRVVARDLRRIRPHENCPGRSDGTREPIVVADEMLWSCAIRERRGFVAAARHDDAAEAGERLFCRSALRQLHGYGASDLQR